jgi:large subunit ribosomal protein L28
MSKVCQLTGKRPIVGNSVSHSNRKTKRRFEPNLQRKRLFVPETGEWITVRLTTQCLRTIDKKGVYQFIKEQQAKGFGRGINLGATGC